MFQMPDVIGDEPVWRNGEVVGWVTSGWQIEILGVMRDATLQPEPIWDATAKAMRS